ncbi:DUF4811 domain-containing protein [Lactiplantibacillus pentosus]|jgi:VCBS repeat-containing protein|uniref:DUF4811 domain-containing protein n=3 Tax=Lactiplantibacillus pentosus TaxID=1589 RepID=A0AAN1F5S0_LACPE|nr:DUF4811 domain-containing protein [Lactiplantibacillus pentosus]ASG80521.1 DUF4811 domain-containing protein [Lactiplantibacillus pentosus]AYG38198.1 DUF4811 domain-containing protein [Lactiplantibacillus pentosus]AYG40856.1 DUF4811 domain-containing protein [Lactiplantibacillus pentosus]AYJ42793.1 DUF4811 domain-containing protein [Lactiplantibacillus pentosus]KRK23532.1 hypothetical protein FD24_GL000957 [Lactiplantibacillus pentosus DSM 20314]
MIIVLLILATFVFAGAMIFARAGRTRVLTTLISGLIIAGGLGALILNDNYHWGMHQVTQTQIQDLAPLQSKRAALRVQQLGTGSERVIAYRVASATKASRTVAATTTTTKLTTGAPAQVQIRTTTWQFKNHWARVLFSLGNTKTKVVARQYLFTIPKTWQVLTVRS